MLDFLHIENVAVAKNIDIEFTDGFNVLTGETGAGKSIIVDSIGLILGAKASRDIVRYGEEKAIVTALFSDVGENVYRICDEYGVPYDRDDSFSISRTVTSDGKSTIKINSRAATLVQLRAISSQLINIHGQNENQSFMDKSNQSRMLDVYSACENELAEYAALYSRLSKLKSQIAEALKMNKQKEMLLDVLKFQIKEISAARLKDENEEEKLVSLRNKLRESEKVSRYANIVYKALVNNESGVSAAILMDKAYDALIRLSEIEPSAGELAEKLKSYKFEITDIAERIHDICDVEGVEDPQKRLEAIESRLALIQRLERKYGSDVSQIIAFGNNAQKQLKELENAGEREQDLKNEYRDVYAVAMVVAEKLHCKREKGALSLGKSVKDALEFLDMPKVIFEIAVNRTEKDGKTILTQNGYDDVEFMIATNAGEELSPMSKIASGGELSRIMLALKSAISEENGAKTVIFDEIDTGVSGSTSQKIGIKLAKIAKSTQTLCVTHSAQIASLAKSHFIIKKSEVDGRAESSVTLLDDTQRESEIARIIGGINVTEKQYAAARDLMKQAESYK